MERKSNEEKTGSTMPSGSSASSSTTPGMHSSGGSSAGSYSSSTPSGMGASGSAGASSGMHGEARTGSNGSAAGSEHDSSDANRFADQIDDGKAKAAETLRGVAQMVRDRGGSAPVPGMDRAAQLAASRVDSSAQYLEEHDPADMWGDVMRFCRAHPLGALLIGFSLGYFVKKLMP